MEQSTENAASAQQAAAPEAAEVKPANPTITLAGKPWEIPVLAPRQNRIVVPRVRALIPKITAAHKAALINPEDASGGIRHLDFIGALEDEETFDQLSEAVFFALTRHYPTLTPKEFADMPISNLELIGAIPVLALQAGLIEFDWK